MQISFINGHPALLIQREKLLVVSDLHIGLEFKFGDSGVHFPNASRRMAEELLGVYKESGATGIAILGDVKESIGNVTRDEERALREFFSVLSGIGIRIAKGNHDAYIDRILAKLGFDARIEKEILLDDAALMHGNFMPSEEAMQKDYIIIGHGHTAAYVNGELEKVWFIAKSGKGAAKTYPRHNKRAKLIIAPAFNRMIMGSAMSSDSKNHIPLLRNDVFSSKNIELRTLQGLKL